MYSIDAALTSDDFTAAATLENVYRSPGGYFSITDADVFASLQYGDYSLSAWTEDVHVPQGNGVLPPGATGVKFRSYTSGVAATVTAALASPGEPAFLITAGGQVSVSGGALPVFNVKAYGAKGDGVTDDTSAINRASTAAAVAGGICFFPQGVYVVTTMLLYSYVWYLGVGEGGHASGGPTEGSIISQKAGTAAPIAQTSATTGLFSIRVEGITFTASANLASNIGGLLLTGGLNCLLDGMTVDNVNTYGVKVLGGTGGRASGDTMYGTLRDVRCTNIAAAGIGFHIAQAAADGSKPDGLTMTDCFVSANSLTVTAVKLESTGADVLDTITVERLRSIGPGVVFDVDANYPRIIDCRFECFGNMTLSLSARTNDAVLIGNSYSAGGGTITFTDLGARTRRLGETGLTHDQLYPEDKQSPIYTNSWADFGAGTNPVTYWRDVDGVIHLEGLAKAPAAAITNSMFTLPAAYRPTSPRYFVVTANDTFGGLVVNTDGTVQLRVGGTVNGTLSLEGLSYRL